MVNPRLRSCLVWLLAAGLVACVSRKAPRPEPEQPSLPTIAVGTEFAVDAPSMGSVGPAWGPAVASDGVNYLLVWSQRSSEPSGPPHLYAARITADETRVLDSRAIQLTEDGSQGRPAVAFDGANYLVAWDEAGTIRGARVSTAGALLDPSPIEISTSPDLSSDVALAFDGSNYLAVWHTARYSSGFAIHAARISVTGDLMDPDELTIASAEPSLDAPAVAFDGTNYLVVWDDVSTGGVHGARLSTTGVVLDTDPISVAEQQDAGPPAVAFDGTNFLVVWGNNDIRGARVSPAGAVLDAHPLDIVNDGDSAGDPALGFDGTHVLVTWTEWHASEQVCDRVHGCYYLRWTADVDAARMSPDGSVLDRNFIPVSYAYGNQSVPAMAIGSDRAMVVWQDDRRADDGAPMAIFGAQVTTSGAVLEPSGVRLSPELGANREGPAAVTTNGSDYLVVWEDHRDQGGIHASRVSATGAVLEGSGLAITTGGGWTPAVASNGSDFLVVWSDFHGRQFPSQPPVFHVHGARVSASGALLDAAALTLAQDEASLSSPAVAFDGANYLVVWEQGGIRAARVSVTGALLDASGVAISPGPGSHPAVSFDGTSFLIVWQNGDGDLYGARVSTSGELLDPIGFAISTASGSQTHPTVAFDGRNHVVVWADSRSATGYDASGAPVEGHDLYAARVSPGGSVLDPDGIPISTATGDQSRPVVAFDGARAFLAWKDSDATIRGVRLSPEGVVLDPSGIALATLPATTLPEEKHGEYVSGLASIGDGSLLLVDVVKDSELQAFRVHARRIGQGSESLRAAGPTMGSQTRPRLEGCRR